MKALMLRQVRLLAVPALVSVALGLVTLFGLSFSSDVRVLITSPAEVALALVALVAPWLIAVAAIAPDAESGGLAFLSGLPLSRARHFALRALVALGWSAAAVLPFGVLAAREVAQHHYPELVWMSLLASGLAFVAGLAAGAVARQSLGAFIVAPLLLVVPCGLYEAFAIGLSAPDPFHVAGPIVVSVLLVVAGWLGFRDPSAATSWRPLLRTVGLLLGAVVLGCGVTTAAWARAIAFPMRQVEWSTQGPVVMRHERKTPDWPREYGDWSTTLYPAADLERVKSLDELADGWTFDEHLRVGAITQDGDVLVQGSAQVMLLDPRAKKVLAHEHTRLLWTLLYDTSEEPLVQEGVAGRPWFVTADSAVRTFGELLHQLPPGARVEATGGTRLVALLSHGERLLLDLVTGATTSVDVASTDAQVMLSPKGRYLAVWSPGSQAPGLTFQDLEGGADVTLTFPEGARPYQHDQLRASFSPNERTVVVSWQALTSPKVAEYPNMTETRTAAVDLPTGTVLDLTKVAEPWWIVFDWSPSGRRLLTDAGWVDLDVDPLAAHRLPRLDGAVRRFLDEDTILWSTDGRIERIELGR